MKTASVIKLAKEYDASGDFDAAMNVLNEALANAHSSKTNAPLYFAKMRILDARIDAMVAASQVRHS